MFDPHKYSGDCLSGATPPCACACPLGVDVRDMIERARIGSNSAAYKAFTKAAPLPGVAAHICPAPCRGSCVRHETDEPVELGEMERFLYNEMRGKPQGSYFIPDKKKRVLIVGGGTAGLTGAVRLAGRGYSVTLAERSARLGGALWDIPEGILPRDVLEADLALIGNMKYLKIALNTEICDLDGGEYDAVLVTTGLGGESFGAQLDETGSLSLRDGVFFAGGIQNPGQDFLEAMREVGDLSFLIENYMKVGRMERVASPSSKCLFKPRAESVGERIPSFMHGEPDAAALKSEAERCLLCSCSECVDVCDMLSYFRRNPKKTIMDISDTINSVPLYAKSALREIMSCTGCGLCTDACPTEVDFKTMCIESRRILRSQGQLPDAYYDYWMNDMEHAGSADASIFLKPGGSARYIYFPGCQMGAADPGYVEKSYDWLRTIYSDEAALMLNCCGAPAYWAGDEELHAAMTAAIRQKWFDNGSPVFILACPTCMDMFADFLPEIETLPLWRLMAEKFEATTTPRGPVSVFDPCSVREGNSSRSDIRQLLTKLGYELHEPDEPGCCCGYGGLIYTANPGLHAEIVEKNSNMSPYPYVTYCTNCRDSFALEGRAAMHILDAVFGDGNAGRKPPELTARRRNREALKKSLLAGGEAEVFAPRIASLEDIRLEIPENIRRKMAAGLILEDNIRLVLRRAEDSGRRVLSRERGVYTAFLQQGKLTYWVEYADTNGVYHISNVYFHRMTIGDLPGEGA